MKKITLVFNIAFVMICCSAFAESTVQVTTVAAPEPFSASAPVQPQPSLPVKEGNVVIINQGVDQKSAVSAIQAELEKQPTTVIESTPLVESRAEILRKEREKAEVETEQKIVEKLEQSRMEAERKRQEEILGAFDGKKEEKSEPAPVVVEPAPVQVQAAPAPAPVAEPVPVVESKATSMDDVRNAVREELNAFKDVEEKPKAVTQNYVSGTVGVLDYNSVQIETIGSAGVSIGRMFDERWLVDLGFMASRAFVDESIFAFRELEQFNLGASTKFLILKGRVRPHVGFLVDFVNRSYSDVRDSATGFTISNSELSSWAIDYGFTVGLDFAVADNLSIGAEYRNISNLTYEFSDDVLNVPSNRSIFEDFEPLEERGSEYMGFNLKYLF